MAFDAAVRNRLLVISQIFLTVALICSAIAFYLQSRELRKLRAELKQAVTLADDATKMLERCVNQRPHPRPAPVP